PRPVSVRWRTVAHLHGARIREARSGTQLTLVHGSNARYDGVTVAVSITRSDMRPALSSTECTHVLHESLVAHSSHSDCPFHVGGLSSRCRKSASGQAEQ